MRALFLAVLGLAAVALVIAPIRTARPEANRIPYITSGLHFYGNFISNGTFSVISTSNIPKGVETRGSWVDGDDFLGDCSTSWYTPVSRLKLMVAGYPRVSGNKLAVEVKVSSGTAVIIPFNEDNPGEIWREWSITLPKDAQAFRIVATDGSNAMLGWLAFSEPFKNLRFPWWKDLCRFAQLFTAFCLALSLLYGPGLCWALYRPERKARWIEAILPGPLGLAGIGILIWMLGGIISPASLARGCLIVVLVALTVAVSKIDFNKGISFSKSAFAPVLLLSVLVCALAISKSSLSMGPEGELYAGTISRTLDPSGHSDSRISYHLVQVIANHLSPSQSETTNYFAPWRLTSRGPLAGLLTAPLVIGCGSNVPLDMPDQTWSPFDRGGFAIYRITMIVLGSLTAWAVFGTVAVVGGETGALFAAIVLLIAPFFVHQIFFTWPKLIAAAHVLLAFVAVEKRSYFGAGVALALGYLYHPLASLSAPFLTLWAVSRIQPWNYISAIRAGGSIALGVMSLVLPWLLFDRLIVAGDTAQSGQRIFLSYFTIADDRPAHLLSWLVSRWHNLSYTFLPFWFLTADFSHASLNSIYHPSNQWIHYSFIYWHTFPFGLGLPAFIATLYPTLLTLRRHLCAAFILLILPVIFLVVYWGAADTGFMSYSGHAIFLTTICFMGWAFSRSESPSAQKSFRLLLHPLIVAARLIDLAFVCLGTTLLFHVPVAEDTFFVNDVGFLSSCLLSLLAIACVLGRVRKRLVSVGDSSGGAQDPAPLAGLR